MTRIWFDLSMILFVIVVVSPVLSKPTCRGEVFLTNFERICKAYPFKRSTHPDYVSDDFGNGIGQWNSNSVNNVQNPGTGSTAVVVERQNVHPFWWFLTSSQDALPQTEGSHDEPVAKDLDPLYFEGEDMLTTLSRWRRAELMRKLEGFMHNCCTRGCSFPHAYWEFDNNHKFCNNFG